MYNYEWKIHTPTTRCARDLKIHTLFSTGVIANIIKVFVNITMARPLKVHSLGLTSEKYSYTS
jgi:hypothetical protein